MKTIHGMITVVGIATGLPLPAEAAQMDLEIIIYRFPGVLDHGGSTSPR